MGSFEILTSCWRALASRSSVYTLTGTAPCSMVCFTGMAVSGQLSCLLRSKMDSGVRQNDETVFGRGDWIRTSDIVLPKHALYQAELHPDFGSIVPQGARRPLLQSSRTWPE